MTPTRVLWLTKGLGPGGAERLLLAVARASDPDRVRYDAAYLLPWKQHLVPELEAAGVTTHLLDGPREIDVRWAARLRRLLLDGRYDVLHAHSPYPAAVGRVVARTLGGRRPALVYTEHNVWSSYRPLTKALGVATYGLDDARIAVAEEVRASMPARWQRSTRTLVHGIDIAAVRAAAARRETTRVALGIDDDEVLVCTLANLRADKDYPNLIAAAEQVVRRCPSARFVAAGQGQLEHEIAATVEAAALGDRFRLLGYRDDANDVLAAADILAVSSRREGLPVAVMEALALGRPVVTTAVGGIPSLVRDGVEGLLVPPSDATALADALIRVIEDPGLRERLGGDAAARAATIDVTSVARALTDLYESVTRHR